MNQSERLLEHLIERGSIDPLQAWSELGIYRLAPIICDLRRSGVEIEKEMIKVKNRFGEDCRVELYKLKEAA